jgi:hypothetical protein
VIGVVGKVIVAWKTASHRAAGADQCLAWREPPV